MCRHLHRTLRELGIPECYKTYFGEFFRKRRVPYNNGGYAYCLNEEDIERIKAMWSYVEKLCKRGVKRKDALESMFKLAKRGQWDKIFFEGGGKDGKKQAGL